MSTKEKNTFSHFFKEDAEVVSGIINGENGHHKANNVGVTKKEEFPKLVQPKSITENKFKAQWKILRSFFRNTSNLKEFPKDLSPVIMAPIYTKSLVGIDFPVWVADEDFDGKGESCLSLKEIITQSLDEIAPNEGDAHILKENIERIIHIANEQLTNKQPQLFQSVINQILDVLENQLDVSGDEVSSFNSSLKKLKKSLPSTGVLLPYSNNTSFQILEAALTSTLSNIRKKLAYDISQLKCRLNDLLRVEREKNPSKANAEKSKDSYDFANSLLNFNEISSISPDAGSESIGEERVKRITTVVEELEETEKILEQQGFMFVDEVLQKNKSIDWENLFGKIKVESYKRRIGCDTISSVFDKIIVSWTKLFIAKRIGELELTSNYQSDIHDDYFKHFTWENFSKEELNNCPHFILIADDIQLFESELNKLSSVISSNIPVKIIAVKKDNQKSANIHSQTELGALMLSHKNIYVAQSTSITPKYLFNAFKTGLTSFSPAFFNILNVGEHTHENPYLWTSSSVESRDFPSFTFNGILGTPWGSRFEIANNPQAENQWTSHQLTVINPEGEKIEMDFSFTFADQAVLSPAYQHYFMLVSPSFWSDDLISLTEYMTNSVEENVGRIPFIWMLDANNDLQKVAVSWAIVLASQERLDFWKFLQENSGINNYHVSIAVEQAKTELQNEHDLALEERNKKHQIEIQQIRDEEAGKVMENLTSVLLNLDTTSVITTNTPATSTAESTTSTNEPTEAIEEASVEEESLLSNDPYIDTALCTSCNECINKNGKLFIYNADKMALIGDPKAGTFAELVESAELCPVSIIHPGSPLNPDEPDLDSLVERAAKFN